MGIVNGAGEDLTSDFVLLEHPVDVANISTRTKEILKNLRTRNYNINLVDSPLN
jgi:hypothetical protein